MRSLADYRVELKKVPPFNTWTWTARTPDGRQLAAMLGLFATKEGAERDALRIIEEHEA